MIDLQSLLPTRWARSDAPRTLGVVMIVRDEAERLPGLLADIADIADEVVVVDTGSADATVSVCRSWGVTLVQEPWRDDFARARNTAIAHATADYLLWLDGDDRIPEETADKLRWLRDDVLPGAGRSAYLMEVCNLGASGEVRDRVAQTRVFPRLPGVEFRYAVHEQVAPSLLELGVEFVRTDFALLHTGYADSATIRRKAERNAAMLRRELERDPTDLHCLVHMAQTLVSVGAMQEAEGHLSSALDALDPERASPFFFAELYAMRAQCRAARAHKHGARYDLERAAEHYPSWAFPYALLAEIHHADESPAEAWAMVEMARGAEYEVGLMGFPLERARRGVEVLAGQLQLARGEADGAVESFGRALDLAPGDVELRLRLGQQLLEHREGPGARTILEPLGRDDSAFPHLVELSAAIGLARVLCGEMDGAVACLAPLLDVFAGELDAADDVDPMRLAEVMLQHGYPTAARNMISLCQATSLAA